MEINNKLDNVYFGNNNIKEFPSKIDTILTKIRYHVLIRRVRVLNFFEDFDKLRSGYVSEEIFKRCIDMILATTATCKLSKEEYNEIAKHYYDSEKKMVEWRSFVDDIDEGDCYNNSYYSFFFSFFFFLNKNDEILFYRILVIKQIKLLLTLNFICI